MEKSLHKRLTALLAAVIMAATTLVAQTTFKISDGTQNQQLRSAVETNVSALIAEMQAASDDHRALKLSRQNMLPTAIADLKKLWASSPMACPPMTLNCHIVKTGTGWQVRGIPVDMEKAAQGEQRQELTIDLSPAGLISNVSISIDIHRYEEIMGQQDNDIDYARRQIIVSFVENFRTAYNRKDIKFLTNVYSDQALIITGRVIKPKPGTDLNRQRLANNQVVYTRQTKQEYLRNLANCFRNNSYINVKFDSIQVAKHPKYDDVYGITLMQTWHSKGRSRSYSDKGYLFLMCDFHDADNPIIEVRTWQPYKDQQGRVITKPEDVFHLGSFVITR